MFGLFIKGLMRIGGGDQARYLQCTAVSHIQRIGCQPNYGYTMANLAPGLLNSTVLYHIYILLFETSVAAAVPCASLSIHTVQHSPSLEELPRVGHSNRHKRFYST